MQSAPASDRTRVRRLPDRGRYDRETIHAILDEALVCHLGFSVDGQPFVIPTTFARVGDDLYVHGSAASRTMRALATGTPVCVTVTLLDGLVLARSAFHHSMNYRSVVVLGRAVEVIDSAARMAAFEAIVEHVLKGRWNEVRWPTEQELRATTVLRLPLDEASAKVRTGGPLDDAEDLALDCWAGVIPLAVNVGAPIASLDLRAGVAMSAAARRATSAED
jgi:nitroimidazol reductase NimA-like FMN-containing flavoprotein (pyridoxamine 5'-phosphate oxidase superfamily)